MSLRGKITLFAVSFLVMSLVLGLGVFYITGKLGENFDVLSTEVQKDQVQDELTDSMFSVMVATKGWAVTRDPKYVDQYGESISLLRADMAKLKALVRDRQVYEAFEKEFDVLIKLSETMIYAEEEPNVDEIGAFLRKLEAQETEVLRAKNELHRAWIATTIDAVETGEGIRINMTFYLTLLVVSSLLLSTFIMLLMKRVLAEPYKMLLDATAKVSSGDLGHRIGSSRKDEFGLISQRFDAMVENMENSSAELRLKLKETELLLAVSRIAGMTQDLKGSLAMMVETISGKMEKDLCAVFLYKSDKGFFSLEACNLKEVDHDASLPIGSSVSQRILGSIKPFIAVNASDYPEITSICSSLGSFMAVPILREQSCVGILLLGEYAGGGFKDEEMDTATIVAHTIGAALRNVELYEETRKQLRQLSILFELSKAMTSVFETDELLKTISSEAAKLINARGCVIRLVEDGKLRVRSFHGPMEDLGEDLEMPLGKGIAGWVAKEGRPIFVEDVSKMPDDMKSHVLAAKSAISVPLKKDEDVLGTLGLYDKIDEKGDISTFSLDDLKLAEGLASLSALAIDKAMMKETEAKIKAKIEEAKKRMDLLFESVQSGIVTLDRSFNITAANKYVERWIDMPLEKIIMNNALDVFHRKGGICPHCAAKATFEEGGVNTITQSSGLNYADLASYPVKDESGQVTEAVVIIQDITERVLYQEEIMGLYREVMQTKEYMESLINNSADAIVTSDIEGVVKSWNLAAEQIFGYTNEEAVGRFLPFVPDSLMGFEKENIEKIQSGEVLRLETFRKRKDGSIIEVSLTLSPIKDVTGEIIGITGITRDITDKKRVEKELIRRNQELSRLFFISSAMRGTLEIDRLLRMVLTAVTMSDGLGFNRAILFLVDDDRKALRGAMGVGPASPEEAWQIWETLSINKRSLREIMRDIEEGPLKSESFLNKLSTSIEISMEAESALAKVVRDKTSLNITNAKVDPYSDFVLIQQLGTEAYAAVPLIVRDRAMGALWVDNFFNRKPITDEDMKFLSGFADQVASAIESARMYQKVSLAEAELENIFRSISDMVFFTGRDYTIKNANQAVMDKFGKPMEEVIGKKCYEVFHGMDEPWPMCPHHKTVETMKPFVEELEDPHMRGTFLTSTSPIFDTDGSFLGTVHVVRDITEINALRERLQATERMAALGEVAAKVAHEIRNPLVSVGGFAKRLEEKLDGNLQEYARIISTEVRRLEYILKDILGFVREVRMSVRKVDLSDVANDTLGLLDEEFKAHGNTTIKQMSTQPLMVSVDPDRVKEAVLNILTNANQATDGGTIHLRTRREEGYGVVEVEDTGCGIKEDDIERIFDPFYTTRPTGTGLGLAIAKRIVEEHNGHIVAESKAPGEGSKFKIYIPLKEE